MRYILSSLLLFVAMEHPVRAQSGADIYHKGVTSAGQVAIGNSDSSRKLNKAPSTLFACGNCHGERAEGKVESGVIAPAITWQQLSQSWRSKADLISRRKPYDLETFGNLLRNGIDSNGDKLSGVMPRYALNHDEVERLADYLVKVIAVNPAGVDDSKIDIAVVFPDDQKLAEMLRQTTLSYFDRVNQQGGIYGRSLRLHEPFNNGDPPFCVLDVSMQPTNSHPINEVVLAIFSSESNAENRFALYQHPLINNALQQKSILKAVHRLGWQAVSIADSGLENALQKLTQMTDSEQLSTVLVHQQSEINLISLLKRLTALNQRVNIITDRSAIAASGLQALTPYKGMIYFPSLPSLKWVSTNGRRQLIEMAGDSVDNNAASKEFNANLSSRVWTLALNKLLITALEQSGRDLTTRKFLQALQSQVDLQTDFTPPISYSAIRRVGSNVVDLQRVH